MISILMPIYNGIEFIEESVGSVINQIYNDWELIIGINGHEENSDVYKIAKKYEQINNKIKVHDLYFINDKSSALNKMLEFCNYDYVALLDVDDIWHEKKLLIQTSLLGKYDVIGSRCIYFGNLNGTVPNIPIGDLREINYDFFTANPMINSSTIINKKLCHWNLNNIEDYDLWLRLYKQNKTFYNFSQILVKHRIHNKSAFNSKGNHLSVPNLLKQHREEK